MDIFSFFTLLGGVSFFLYGMHVMSGGLTKVAGSKLELTLRKMTDSLLKSLMLGAGITIAIQSSSALTVMLVGLVNSGIMQLGQTVGIIMGSNIGTTLTAWLLSLSGLESDTWFIRLLKPESFAPILALVGILLIMASKSRKKKDIGEILLGFAILMYGMQLMSSSVSPLKDMPEFADVLTAFSNPVFGVIVGAVFTGIIQSSAASVGILQALSLTGNITFGMAIPIIMGQNIGTCVTALLSSIGVSKNAKRVAVVHISFNLIGTFICLILFFLADAFLDLPIISQSITPFGIAVFHSLFNVFTTVILLPFTKQLEQIARFVVKGDDVRDKEVLAPLLDARLLRSPSFAIAECVNFTAEMAELARDTLLESITLLTEYDEQKSEEIMRQENKLDHYEDQLGGYMMKISASDLTEQDSRKVSKVLHGIGDFERIGDHAVNILEAAQELREKGLTFSPQAQHELSILSSALKEILFLSVQAYITDDVPLATKVEPLEEVIDELTAEIKFRHVERLQNGQCTIQLGFILSDLLTNYERVSDHCSNIALYAIETAHKNFDPHTYLHTIKSESSEFKENFDIYRQRYDL